MNLIDCIWEGKQFVHDDHFKSLRDSFLKEIGNQFPVNLENEIGTCKSEIELILKFKIFFKWIPVAGISSFPDLQKSVELSTALRERANLSYKTGNVSKALRGYNLAITFAPQESPELGLGFGNRSALFLHMKEHKLAVEDIRLALSHKFPSHLTDKLLQRRDKCEKLLAEENTEKLDDHAESKRYCEENYFRLKSPHKSIPNAEDWVEITLEADRGRKLVATKDVPAGTLILIDKPWISLINEILKWDLQHCHFCSLPILAGLPCTICSFTFYCDETCRIKSLEGSHKFEHGYLPYLHCIAAFITHKDLQSLRVIGTLGPQKLEEYFKNPALLNSSSSPMKGFNEKGIFDSDSYLPIYHLISHNQLDVQETLLNLFKSFVFTHLLKDMSDFFDDLPITDEFFQNFVTCLLYRHINSIRFNAISMTKLKSTASGEQVSLAYATATYPLLSLGNHSCDPNAVPVKIFRFLQTALVSLKNLKAGEEIFITYKPLFSQMKTLDRQEHLRLNYNFTCSCPACQNNWTIKSVRNYSEMELLGSGSNCTECQKTNLKFKKCEECLQIQSQKVKQFEKYESQLHEINDEVGKGNYLKALKLLRPCLIHFTGTSERIGNASSLNSLTQVAMELYKRALLRVVYQAQHMEL